MTKSKTEKHKVEYKGRFLLNKSQINSDIAHRLLLKCSNLKKRKLVKTTLKLHESGFHIGNASGLVNIRKLWFYFKDMKNYFVFDDNRKAVILVTNVKEKYFMSYFCFVNEDSLNRLTNALDNLQPHGHDNPEFIDETIDAIYQVTENSDENTENEDNVDNFLAKHDDDDDDENNSEPLHEDPVEIKQVYTTENLFIKHDSRIDNLFQSSYADLFTESDYIKNPTNDDFSNDFLDNELTEIIGGSMYLFSEKFVIPVLKIDGTCESEEEDI